MPEENVNGRNGLRTLGMFIMGAALIGTVIWEQGDTHERATSALEERVAGLEAQSRRGDMDHATHTARFTEVETQFKWLREVMEKDSEHQQKLLDDRGRWIMAHDKEIAQRDAEQWERIKALERIIYKERGP